MNRSIVLALPLFTAVWASGAAAQATPPEAKPAPSAPALAPLAPSEAAPAPVASVASVAPVAPSAAPPPVPAIAAEHVTLSETQVPTATEPHGAVRPSSPVPPDRPSPPIRHEGPVRSRFNVAVNVDTNWYTHRSYDLFSENDAAQNAGLSVGYAVWMSGPMSLVPEIGFGVDGQSASTLYGGAVQSTALNTKRFYGGISLRYALLSFLELHGRLAGGASIIKATVTPGSDASTTTPDPAVSQDLTDTKTSPFASLGAGVTLRTRDAAFETNSGALRSLVLGLTAEGGYVLAKSIDLTPSPEHPSGRIRTTDATLGTLERSAPYARLSAFVRF